MLIRLFLLFTIVPALELFLLLQLGSLFGAFPTFLIVVITGAVGAWLAKREGLGVMTELREELQQGMPPGSRIAEGVLVFIGGILLVTPGVLTDLTGFLLIFPVSRRWLAPRLVEAVSGSVNVQFGMPGQGMPGGAQRPGGPYGPGPQGPGSLGSPSGPPPGARSDHPTPFSSPFDDLP